LIVQTSIYLGWRGQKEPRTSSGPDWQTPEQDPHLQTPGRGSCKLKLD